MKSVFFDGKGNLEIKEIDKPSIKPDEVLIKVKCSGVCTTDLHSFYGESVSEGDSPYPLVPGHEVSGIVEKVGNEVHELKIGDKIAIDPFVPCNECFFCKNRKYHYCQNVRTIGTNINGGFAEFLAAPASSVHKFEGIDYDAAALAEPLSTVIYGQERCNIEFGDELLIIGAGPMGLLHLQLAKHTGAKRIVVVDVQKDRLKKAEELGAEVINAKVGSGTESTKKILESTRYGYDVVIEATGIAKVVEASVDLLNYNGRLLIFGVAPQKSKVTYNPYTLYRNDYQIIGAFALNKTLEKAVNMLSNGILDVSSVLGKKYKLSEMETALSDLENKRASGKLQITFDH